MNFCSSIDCRDVEKAKSANSKDVQQKETQLRQELNVLLKQSLKFDSRFVVSRSYPLLFGDPDQLASQRSKTCQKKTLIDRWPDFHSFRTRHERHRRIETSIIICQFCVIVLFLDEEEENANEWPRSKKNVTHFR
jgi:hypothetical protein